MRVAIVGAGNVATHLAIAISKAGGDIVGVFSRTLTSATELASKIGVRPYEGFCNVKEVGADVVIISLADNAVEDVVGQIGALSSNTVILLTSGTISMDILRTCSSHVGVFYPLQTFSKSAELSLTNIPFFVEASDQATTDAEAELARLLGVKTFYADESARRRLHVAGVLSNNFVNVLLECVQGLFVNYHYDLSVVKPLVEETIRKAFQIGPHAAQTGPARRGDMEVMHKHLEILPPDIADVYVRLSKIIMDSHNIPYKDFNPNQQ